MVYHDGQSVKLGDSVAIGADRGRVVGLIADGEYAAGIDAREWGYLGVGLLIQFDRQGLTHYPDRPEADISLIARAEGQW